MRALWACRSGPLSLAKGQCPPLAAGGSATWQQVHPAQGLHLPSGQPTGVEARAAAVPAGEERNGRMSPPTGPGRDAGGAGSRWAEPKHARGGAAPCGRAFSWRSIAPRQGRGGPAARPGPREGGSNARAALRIVGREEGRAALQSRRTYCVRSGSARTSDPGDAPVVKPKRTLC